MAISNIKALFLLDTLNSPRKEHDKLDCVPYCDEFPEGFSYAILRKESVKNLLDLNYDGYHRWTGFDRNTKKQVKAKNTSRPVAFVDSKFVITQDEAEVNPLFRLKLMTNRHCQLSSFRREIFFMLDENANLMTDVVYRYNALAPLCPPLTTQMRLIPSEAQKIKSALEHRKTNDAKKVLRNEGIHVTTRKLVSLSRTVNSHVKSNIGRKTPTDYHKILDRHLARAFKDELLHKPEVYANDEGKLVLQIIFGYPNAFKTYISGLSTLEDLSDHGSYVDSLEKMRGKDATICFNSFLGSLNSSGAIPTIGSCLLIDTTFSVCTSEYLTLAIGVSDDFQNKLSSKSSSILLGGMIHSSKASEIHETFSNFLNMMFLKFDKKKEKGVGLIIVDGEDSFRHYKEGEYLSSALQLRCDRHRLDNLKTQCETTEEFDLIQKALYGEKERTATGFVLKEAVLQSLNRDTYTERLFKLVSCSFVSEKAKTWLMGNSSSLYEHNSLLSKLRGGWPVQFLTTNIIEARNGALKELITSKKPGERVLDDLLFLHRGEINDRMNAMIGVESPLKCIMFKTQAEWKKMKTIEKRNFLELSGLGYLVVQTELDEFPPWAVEEITCTDSFIETLHKLDIFESKEDGVYFVYNTDSRESTRVVTENYHMTCSNRLCDKFGLKNLFCVHKVKVLQRFSSDIKALFFNQIEEQRKGVTYMQLMRINMKPSDGTKYSKRKGRAFSSNNQSRAIEQLSSSFDRVISLPDEIPIP